MKRMPDLHYQDAEARYDAIQALAALRKRVAAIAATLPDVVWSVEVPSREVLYVSPAVTQVFGIDCTDLYGGKVLWSDLVHPEDRQRVLSAWDRAIESRTTFEAEYRAIKAGGRLAWIHGKASPAIGPHGQVVRMDGISRDITDRREHERKIAQLSRIHAVSSGINAAIIRSGHRQGLFEEACRIAVEQGGFGMVWIGLVDQQSGTVQPSAHFGFPTSDRVELAFNMKESAKEPSNTAPRAILEQRPVHSNDMALEPCANVTRKVALEKGYRSVISLPLICTGVTVGVMFMYAHEPNFFDSEEISLLTNLAADLSYALEKIDRDEKLKYLANYDELTGLPNRALFRERLAFMLEHAKHQHAQTGVAVANIKRFTLVNESFGRKAGDGLLRELAQRLRALWPDSENMARVAPDTFAFAIPVVRDPLEISADITKCLEAAILDSFRVETGEIRIAMNTGIAVSPPDADDAELLVTSAEVALRKAKATGEQVLYYQPQMNARVAENLLIENKMHRAIEKDEFVLHYQPKVAAVSGAITGVEALIRWRDPGSGLVAPAKFIPILEDSGLIIKVGAWAMRKALEDCQHWMSKTGKPLRISVNVSAIQLRQRTFVETVRQSIERYGVTANQLDLEITESMIMEDVESTVSKLAEIREMGVNISVDDFGTGYSSLGYLAKLPINALKIDRSFVAKMTSDAHSMALVSTIISLARALDLKVIAEGVESEEQAKILRLLKCDEMQGYFFGKPVSIEGFKSLLRSNRR